MIKKLDKLILKAFFGPFVATFFVTLFILVMQFFWKYIDDLVGKGLDFITLAKLTGYVSATALTLALPLAVLISSIMTFGNLGESMELVAIKASGIPLLRFMRPLFFTSILIAGVAFLFSNNIIPVANLKFNTLLYDITISKPAFDIKEGVFYDKIEGYTIKIGKKEADGATIKDVVIFEKGYGLQDNIILAEKGKMSISADKKFLEFHLENGWSYQEKGQNFTANTDFIRLGFKEYLKVFDLSSFQLNKTADSAFKHHYRMKSIRQLNKDIDSLQQLDNYFLKKAKVEVDPYMNWTRYLDSTWPAVSQERVAQLKTFKNVVGDTIHPWMNDRVINQVNSVSAQWTYIFQDFLEKQKDLSKHLIEWHRKFSLSAACIILFFIGAPLGSIIRKGGLGMPMVIAVIFFIIFHLLNTFGEKFAKGFVLSPFAGMWLSSFILIPVGAFLTYKAMIDSQLFNKEFYFRIIKKLEPVLKYFKPFFNKISGKKELN